MSTPPSLPFPGRAPWMPPAAVQPARSDAVLTFSDNTRITFFSFTRLGEPAHA